MHIGEAQIDRAASPSEEGAHARAVRFLLRLQRVTEALTPQLRTDEIARTIVDAATQVLGADIAGLFMPDGDVLQPIARSGDPTETSWDGAAEVALDSPLAIAEAFRSGRTIWAPRNEEWRRLFPSAPPHYHRDVEGVLAVPLDPTAKRRAGCSARSSGGRMPWTRTSEGSQPPSGSRPLRRSSARSCSSPNAISPTEPLRYGRSRPGSRLQSRPATSPTCSSAQLRRRSARRRRRSGSSTSTRKPSGSHGRSAPIRSTSSDASVRDPVARERGHGRPRARVDPGCSTAPIGVPRPARHHRCRR